MRETKLYNNYTSFIVFIKLWQITYNIRYVLEVISESIMLGVQFAVIVIVWMHLLCEGGFYTQRHCAADTNRCRGAGIYRKLIGTGGNKTLKMVNTLRALLGLPLLNNQGLLPVCLLPALLLLHQLLKEALTNRPSFFLPHQLPPLHSNLPACVLSFNNTALLYITFCANKTWPKGKQ